MNIKNKQSDIKSRSKLRVAIVNGDNDPLIPWGGGELLGQNTYIYNLGRNLAKHLEQVDVFTLDQGGQLAINQRRVFGGGVRLFRLLGNPRDEDSQFSQGLLNKIKNRHQYDIIHSYLLDSVKASIDLKKSLSIPLVMTFQSTIKDQSHSDGAAKELKRIFKYVDRIIAVSPQEKIDLISKYGLDDQRISVIPPGVNRQIFSPLEKKIARNKLGINQDKKMFIYVGRLKRHKGILTLVNAVWHIKKYWSDLYNNLEIYIISNDFVTSKKGVLAQNKLGNEISRKIDDFELGDKIKLLGPMIQKDLHQFYAAADATVIPSEHEPLGTVGLESMSSGTPVIASFIGGLKWTVEDEITGLHFKVGDAQELAHKLVRIIKNPKLDDRLSKNALIRIKKDFNWKLLSSRIIALYHDVISEYRAKRPQ